MRKQINQAIKHLGLEISGEDKDGCFYFIETATNTALNADSVFVSSMTVLSVPSWVREASYARRSDIINNSSSHRRD